MTGGIASYKSVTLARRLTLAGAAVDVVLTRAAREFVGPVTFEGVTGRGVHSDLFAPGEGIAHIRLAREADALLVAPATADFLARAAHGRADDLLTALLLALTSPVVLAPAMNDRMWGHPQTVRNVGHLRTLGYRVIEPAVGALAAGEAHGAGRLPEPEVVLAELGRALTPASRLAGRRVLVTAGGTREPIDAVRFIGNHSSGRMGVALAAAAWLRGAEVTLVAGALEVAPPPGVSVQRVGTAAEMHQAVVELLPGSDVLIMAAAPADFRPEAPPARKIRKSESPRAIALTPTVDILEDTVARRGPGSVIVGFALETDDLLARAREKLAAKRLDLIVANPAGEPGAGFGTETNRVTVLDAAGGVDALPLLPKGEVAERILDRVEALLGGR